MLSLVLLACYGLASLLLSAAVAAAWRGGLVRDGWRSESILALRLLPSIGAFVLTVGVALPAFMEKEPGSSQELAGPLVLFVAALVLLVVADGAIRGSRACAATGPLRRRLNTTIGRIDLAGGSVEIVDADAPLVAVIGVWRQHIIASRSVVDSCCEDEFRQVIAHEAAHVAARDNLRALLMLASPDFLARTPIATAVARRWRCAAEFEADDWATGADRSARVALASALVKVARLASKAPVALPVLSASIVAGEVEDRVRRLLAPPRASPSVYRRGYIIAAALLIPLMASPGYEAIHDCLETIVAVGR